MLTEYHTANHANALVNLMYFKGDSSVGYHIHTVRGNNPTHLLDHAIDFRIARVTSGIMTFQLLDESASVLYSTLVSVERIYCTHSGHAKSNTIQNMEAAQTKIACVQAAS